MSNAIVVDARDSPVPSRSRDEERPCRRGPDGWRSWYTVTGGRTLPVKEARGDRGKRSVTEGTALF